MYISLGNSIFPKKITVVAGNEKFRNATGSALYNRALTNYNTKLAELSAAQTAATNANNAVLELQNYIAPAKIAVKDNNLWAGVDYVLLSEGYGDPFYNGKRNTGFAKWLPNPNLRTANAVTSALIDLDWSYIYSFDGSKTSHPLLQDAQWFIIKDFIGRLESGPLAILNGTKVTADANVTTKQTEVATAKTELDRAIEAEKSASDQRIKENQTNPAFIKAKQEYDLAVMESNNKAKNNKYILIGGIVVVLVVGGILLLSSKSKDSKKTVVNVAK